MPPFRRRPDRANGGFIRLDSRAVIYVLLTALFVKSKTFTRRDMENQHLFPGQLVSFFQYVSDSHSAPSVKNRSLVHLTIIRFA